MRDSACNYFQNMYTEECNWRPKLDILHFNRLDDLAISFLEADFTETEIYDCLNSCDRDKAPDPDGFNRKFFQVLWGILKVDVMKFFKDFCKNSSFVKSLNSTYMVLISKKKNASNIKKIQAYWLNWLCLQAPFKGLGQ